MMTSLRKWIATSRLVSAKVHDGGMVAVMCPPEVTEQLKKLKLLDAPGAEPDNLHITLAFLGKADDLDKQKRRRIRDVLKETCSNHGPLDIKIGGFGKFLAGPDGTPLYASATGPGLSQLQADVERVLKKEIDLPSKHGWIAHMTLGYLKPGSTYQLPEVEKKELPSWKTNSVELVLADESIDTFPLSGERRGAWGAVNVQFRPGLLFVFRANPKWYKGYEKGFWFVMDKLPIDVAEIFADINKSHGRDRTEENFHVWKEGGYKGWWTLAASSAATAHKILEYKGYDLDYKSGLPFEREYEPWEPPTPEKTRWEGDYSSILKAINMLLANPALQPNDRKYIDRYWKQLRARSWLYVSQVENLKKVMRRPHNFLWLREKGFMLQHSAEFREAKDKSCGPGRHEGPKNRCITDSQEDALMRRRDRARDQLRDKQKREKEQLQEEHEREREQLSRRQNRQRTRTQVAGWDDHFPYAGKPPEKKDPRVEEGKEDVLEQGLGLTGPKKR